MIWHSTPASQPRATAYLLPAFSGLFLVAVGARLPPFSRAAAPTARTPTRVGRAPTPPPQTPEPPNLACSPRPSRHLTSARRVPPPPQSQFVAARRRPRHPRRKSRTPERRSPQLRGAAATMARALTREEEKELRRQQRREERREQRRSERRARRAEREQQREAEVALYNDGRVRDRSRSRSRSRSRERGVSRPSGRWTDEERRQGWLLTRSAQWAANGRVRIEDKAGFLERGSAWLEWWKSRAASEELATSERKAFMERMYELATSHGHVCGKWMVFAPVSIVDALWADIVEANVAGRLGGCCKVCAHNRVSDTHLICIYCRDFNDVRECQRVLYNLHNICASHGVRIIANFKADFLTALGVYKSASPNVSCTFTLRELKLVKEWPNRRLKRILDNLKRQVRLLEAQRDEDERAATAPRPRTRTRSRLIRS